MWPEGKRAENKRRRIVMATQKKVVVAGELYESITGQLFEIGRQLRQPSGYPFDPEMLKAHLQDAIEGRFVVSNPYLRLISGDEDLIIDPCDGTELLADANDVFAYIDSDFKNWGVDEKGETTKETPARVYEMTQDGTFAQLFGSLNVDVRKLCFTQAQIKGFVKKHRKWLRSDGYATFFFFESHNELFVAYVYFYSDGKLEVRVRRFERLLVWSAGDRHRLVVPQMAV